MVSKKLFFGMAIQALMTSGMTYFGAIDPVPEQQLVAGIGFIVVALVFGKHA